MWGVGGPTINGVTYAENFGAVWSGVITFAGGHYTWTTAVDDWFRIIIDGTTFVDQWNLAECACATAQYQTTLTPGTHSITYQFWEKTGGAHAQFSASTPCSSSPCQNGGTCTTTSYTAHACACPNTYYGINCENKCDSITNCIVDSTCTSATNEVCATCGAGYYLASGGASCPVCKVAGDITGCMTIDNACDR